MARVNEQQDYHLFKELFVHLYERFQSVMPNSKFKLKGVNNIILMVATTIKLCLELFPWAEFRQKKAAIKLHVGLKDNGLIPDFCDLTNGKVHEIKHSMQKNFHPRSLLIFYRGYTDYM